MLGIATALLTPVPQSHATPIVPDVDSLIDASGPLPGSVKELPNMPHLVFATESGLVCKLWQGRITHDVNCTGDIPGAPPEAHTVQLPGIYGKGSMPARFVATPAGGLTGGAAPTATLTAGHKRVFWDFSPTQSMICGVPPDTKLVCVLKEPEQPGGELEGPVVSHGFVIAEPQSWVF